MITPNHVLDVLTERLREALPEDKKIYQNLVPKSGERPCTMVECIGCKMEQRNAGLYRLRMTFRMTSLVSTDERHYSHLPGLYEKMIQTMKIFSAGYLKVKDRALTVEETTGESNYDYAEITVSLSLTLAKEDLEAADIPMMQELRLRTKHQNGGKL